MSTHDSDRTAEAEQWERDHPDGLSAEEEESMDRYAYEACRDECGVEVTED